MLGHSFALIPGLSRLDSITLSVAGDGRQVSAVVPRYALSAADLMPGCLRVFNESEIVDEVQQVSLAVVRRDGDKDLAFGNDDIGFEPAFDLFA